MAGDWKVDGGRLWTIGIVTSIVAAIAAAVVWLFATEVFDTVLFVAGPGQDPQELNVGLVLGFAFVMGILATGVLHLLLAFVPRGEVFFGVIATLVLLVSFIPLATLDVTTENKLWLAAMHIAVYIIVVPTLAGSIDGLATRVDGPSPEEPGAES